MNNKIIDITVYTQNNTLQGSLEIPIDTRLSDFLNNKTSLRSDFIAIQDVTLISKDGIREDVNSVYINKNHIKMITTQQHDSTRGMGSKEGPKQYPYVQKYPIKVNLALQGFELSGNLHCNHNQDITRVFDNEVRFVPCTDATIHEENADSLWRTDFASVNKGFIQCIKQI